jgi:hypothetical protein
MHVESFFMNPSDIIFLNIKYSGGIVEKSSILESQRHDTIGALKEQALSELDVSFTPENFAIFYNGWIIAILTQY